MQSDIMFGTENITVEETQVEILTRHSKKGKQLENGTLYHSPQYKILTFNGNLLSLPDGLIIPFAFKDSNDTSSPSLNPATSMSLKFTGTYFGNPARIPVQRQ